MPPAAMFPPGMTPEMFGFMIQAMTSMMHPMMQPQGTPPQGTPVQGLRQLPPAVGPGVMQSTPVPVAAVPPATNEEDDEEGDEEDDAEEEGEEEAPQEEEEEAED